MSRFASLALSLLSLVSISLLVFSLNEPYLLWNMDGLHWKVMIRQQATWLPYISGYPANLFESLGNLWYPMNMALDPGFLLARDPVTAELDVVWSYTIFSIELFICVWLLASMMHRGVVVALLAPWIYLLAVMPYQGLPLIDPIFAMAPNYTVAQFVLLLVLFRQIGRGPTWLSGLSTLGILILLAHVTLSHPTLTVLMAPPLAVLALALLVASDHRRERWMKLGASGVAIAVLSALGFSRYLIGIFRYTAAYFYGPELFNDRTDTGFVSVLFHDDWGTAFFLLALLGAGLSIRATGVRRALAMGLLVCMSLLVSLGVPTVLWAETWRGPSPLYLEFFLWPIYAVFAAIALVSVVGFGARVLRPSRGWPRLRVPTAVGVAVLPWILLLAANPKLEPRGAGLSALPPPVETPIVRVLRREIALAPGSSFRGRVATLTGQHLKGWATWHHLNGNDMFELNRRFGNGHRSIWLWYFDIPTLFELGSQITPAFYLFTREFLERPGDIQLRNAMTLRRWHSGALRALGARFVIADAPAPDAAAELRVRLDDDEGELFLYELSGANVGQYSPTHVRVIEDLERAFAALKEPGFDFERTAIVPVPILNGLVPSEPAAIEVGPSTLYVRARSAGRSLVVLPFEYSRCWTLESTIDGPPPQPIRTNVLFLGLLFERQLDAKLTYFTGPLHNSGCRMEDAAEFEALGPRALRREPHTPEER